MLATSRGMETGSDLEPPDCEETGMKSSASGHVQSAKFHMGEIQNYGIYQAVKRLEVRRWGAGWDE